MNLLKYIDKNITFLYTSKYKRIFNYITSREDVYIDNY